MSTIQIMFINTLSRYHLLPQTSLKLFSETKVWTRLKETGTD